MKTITYEVPNISCHHCVHTIKMEVEELEGVQSVEGDVDGRKVTITFGAPAEEDQIIALMNEINYPPVIA
jgi:copper chaperone CopZ